jgi:hypothetical protein
MLHRRTLRRQQPRHDPIFVRSSVSSHFLISAAQIGHARLLIHPAPREVAMVDGIRINRAPVLTLWAAVVAERLGLRPY